MLTTKNLSKLLFIALSLLFTVLSCYLLFKNLGKFPLENWDEAFYGQTVKEMIALKDPIVLHWNYAVWFEKPPMFMWIVVLLTPFLGLTELAMRLPSAIFALIIVLSSTYFVYKKYSLLASVFTFFTLILNNVFIWRARSGNIDLLASFLIFVTFFVQISKNKYKYPLLGILFALLYLTKASLVLFPLSIFVISEIIFEYKNFRKNIKEYLKFALCFFGITGLWLGLGYLEAGSNFIYYNLFQSDQGVASITKLNPNYLLHVYYSLQRRFFWFLLVGLAFALFKIKDKKYFLLIAYSLLLLFQLSLTTKDNNWYLNPSMPFWSILIGFGVYSALNILKKTKLIYFVFIVALISVSSYLWFKTFKVNILPILDSSSVVSQAKSAKEISRLTSPTETIIRLDALTPTTLYYSSRKTLSYFPNTNTRTYWINSEDLLKAVEAKKYKWFVGTNEDVATFYSVFDSKLFKEIRIDDQELILNLK
jgi:4-amino-4-deoxy-L-arabinose transferase-like glycosyltransferase